MKEILNLVEKYCNKFCITSLGKNKSAIVMAFDYKPFKKLDAEEYVSIDAYYFISNKSYFLAKKLAKELTEAGIDAKYRFDINYKKLANKAGFGSYGKNTLLYLNDYGSRFVMQVVEIEGEYKYNTEKSKPKMLCKNCNKCEVACPNGAIADEFIPENCLRHHMERGEHLEDALARKMGNKLLGCDICQTVCPMNAHIKSITPVEEIKRILKIENLIKMLNSQANVKKELSPLIGINYSRLKKLLPQFIVNMSNNKTLSEGIKTKLKSFENKSEVVNKNLKRIK